MERGACICIVPLWGPDGVVPLRERKGGSEGGWTGEAMAKGVGRGPVDILGLPLRQTSYGDGEERHACDRPSTGSIFTAGIEHVCLGQPPATFLGAVGQGGVGTGLWKVPGKARREVQCYLNMAA